MSCHSPGGFRGEQVLDYAKMDWKNLTMIRNVHLIFKTHLDIGFTDLAECVINRYFEQYIPRAIELSRAMREKGGDRFIWTTGSWLIYAYLEHASGREKQAIEQAIAAGDIAWHALPFTTHTELMDANLFRFGLGLSQDLDRRFNRHTHAAKMTDVPGHTRGIIPLLAEAGVDLLHIGVNPASAVPDVPPAFRWRSSDGQEVTIIYQGVYGSTFSLDGFDEALAFAHSDDNMGPQTLEQVQAVYQHLRQEFPSAEVAASTLDAFAIALQPFIPNLPVFTGEIGDTWIHGAGSDPLKVMRFRELLRLQREWEQQGRLDPASKEAQGFDRWLLMVPEHTWGMDIKTHLADTENYTAQAFKKACSLPNFKKVESSWEEKRRYIDRAVQGLSDAALSKQASERLLRLQPSPPPVKGFTRQPYSSHSVMGTGFHANYDPQAGSLVALQWADGSAREGCCLGGLTYHIFDVTDFDRVWDQYIRHSPLVDRWAKADFTKPGLEKLGLLKRKWHPQVRDIYSSEGRLLVFATFAREAHEAYGAPEWITLEWEFGPGRISLVLQLFNKSACRIPEALWLAMLPGLDGKVRCRMDKLGEWIDPMDVVSRGNRALHAIGESVQYTDDRGRVALFSPDAPLMAPGAPPLMEFADLLPDLRQGPHFNLFNNLWGTNFPMWLEGDLKYRFELLFEE